MPLKDILTDDAVLTELGRRLARHRLARNWTQAELAARAGLGKATVQRVERGESVQMSTAIKLLRALELLEGLDAAVPPSIELPIARWEQERRRQLHARRRARGRRTADEQTAGGPWRWADQPGEGRSRERT